MRTPICTECGAVFETSHPRKSVCSEECKRVRDRRYALEHYYKGGAKYEQVKQDQRAHRQSNPEMCYTIIHDPLGEDGGGYRPGSTFNRTEIMDGLRQPPGKRAFVTGTLLERKGKKYKVVGAKLEAIC